MADAADILARADRMQAARGVFAQHWEEIRRLIAASAAPFVGTAPPGAKAHQDVLDNTGETASEQLAAALVGSMVSPSSRWFQIKAQDPRIGEDEQAAIWLEHCTDRMYGVFNSVQGNFASQIHETFLDMVDFGTAGLYVADDVAKGRILFNARPLRELYLAENHEGRVDTVVRRFSMTARQALQRWSKDCPKAVREAAEKPDGGEAPFQFLHEVAPRAERDAARRDVKNLPVSSIYVCIDTKEICAQSGYHEMPFLTPRWMKRAGEVYGRGPGMKALADVKMLQRMMRVTIRGGEKVVDPPLLVPDDGVMGPVRTAPSALNVVRADLLANDTTPIRALQTGGRPDLGEEMMKGVRERIEAAYYYNLLNSMMRNPNMTATQANLLAVEVRRVLGPVLGRLESELLGPMIDRVFAIMLRADAFDPPPPSLHGQELKIEYVSPIAKAQRAEEALSIERTFALAQQVAAFAPDVLDLLDTDGAMRRYADLNGYPKDLMRAEDDVAKRRDARAEAQAQQQQTAALHQDVATAADAAKALPAVRQALAPETQTAGQA